MNVSCIINPHLGAPTCSSFIIAWSQGMYSQVFSFIFFSLVPFGVHFQRLGKNLGVCHNNKVFKHGI
jgi:hypothetical protein